MTAEITEEPVQPVQDDVPAEDAPYGYMTDPVSGERRPKKRPGRRSKTVRPPSGNSPALEELQALGTLPEASEDTAPGAPPKGRRKTAMKTEAPLPPLRAGVLAKAINKQYRRAGRLLRLFDYDIGTAVIASTKRDPDDEDDDDTTVGAAWEELARTNPRIKAFLIKFMIGGAWGALFQAHLPILMAIAMKEGIRTRIPFLKLAEVFLTDEPDEEEGGAPVPSGLANMMGGINPDDMAQMMAMAQGMMGQMAAGVPRPANGPYRGPSVSHPPLGFDQGVNGIEHPADQG